MKRLLSLGILLTSATLASAQCWQCASSGGYPSCDNNFAYGASVCADSADPPYCQTTQNDCGCPPGQKCSAPSAGNADMVKTERAAFQAEPPRLTIESFVSMLDSGKYDYPKWTLHVVPNSVVGRGLMTQVPISHWRSFSQREVLSEDGKTQKRTELDIVTKSGHTVRIVMGK